MLQEDEDNVRKGFFDNNEYITLPEALPDCLKPVLALGTISGWRMKEILNLKWNRLDLEQGKAWIAPGETKKKEGREIYLDADRLGKLNVWRAKRNLLCPYFAQRDAQKIKRFTKAWEAMLRACGFIPLLKCRVCGGDMDFPKKKKKVLHCPSCGSSKLRSEGRIFYDLERSAIRENVRAGIPVGVAMKLGGHKTMSVFERYNITDEKDLKRAAEMRSFRTLALEGGGENRGDNSALSVYKSTQESKYNLSKSLMSAPVAQVDRAMDS
jgi:integrase